MKSINLWGRIVAVAVLLLLAVGGTAFAQLQTGNLYGTVKDDQGAALPGVTVTLTGGGAPQVQVTNAQGQFRFLSLAPGSFALKAELEGFSTIDYPNIVINVGRNTSIEVTLSAAVEDVITVTAESPLLDERRISTGATVASTELEKIPTARDPWAILQTTPGVLTDRINVGGNESGQQSQYVGPGSGGDQAIWAVDGMVITDMAALGSSPAYYDFDAFEEMQVTTGGSDTTIATGGVVLNMVTKRGTNEWRGSGRYYNTDDGQQADRPDLSGDLNSPGSWNTTSRAANNTARVVNDPGGPHDQFDSANGDTCGTVNPNFPSTCQPFKQGNRIVSVKDYGAEVGGPIIKDRLWIWGSYGRQKVSLLTISDVSDFTDLKSKNVKLNAQIAANNSATGFYFDSEKVKIGRNAGPTRPQETTWDQGHFGDKPTAYKVEDTHIFSSNFYLTGMFSHVNGGFELVPEGGLNATAFLDDTSTWHNTFELYQTGRPQDQYKADASNFFNTGSLSHELKFGAGYREAEVTTLSRWGGVGVLYDGPTAFGFGAGFPYNVIGVARDANLKVTQQYTSAYAQDTLTAGNLTANIGIRYDKQGGHNDPSSVRANPLLPTAMPAASFRGGDIGFEWTDITPRLGITYALGAERKTLLRASYSRFADQLGTGTAVAKNPLAALSYSYYYANPNNTGANFGVGDIYLNYHYGFSGNVDPATHLPIQVNDVDPNLSAPQTDELLLGVEHALLPEFVVGINLTYRKITDILENELLVFDGDPYSAANIGSIGRVHRRSDYVLGTGAVTGIPSGATSRNVTVCNPGTDRVTCFPSTGRHTEAIPLQTPDGKPFPLTWYELRPGVFTRGGVRVENGDREQEYKGASLVFNKRLANRWMLRGNFTWADWKWSKVPTSELEDPTINLGGGDREGDPVLQGSGTGSGSKGGIYINSKWSYSINGLYQIMPDRPWGFNFALNLTGRQGYPIPYWFRELVADPTVRIVTVAATPRPDTFRNDDIHIVDARIEKEFTFSDFGLTIGIDGFNLFNESYVLQRQHRLGIATSNNVTEVTSPRIFRIGARLSFR